jgi:hypothetical protein
MNIVPFKVALLINSVLACIMAATVFLYVTISSQAYAIVPLFILLACNALYLAKLLNNRINKRVVILITFITFLLLTFSPYLGSFTSILIPSYTVFCLSFFGLNILLITDLSDKASI